jgi:hypothetical protein
MVRVHFPPAASQVRTCLLREFAFLRREAGDQIGMVGDIIADSRATSPGIRSWPPICPPTPTARSSGPSTAMAFVGSASFSLPPEVCCGCGRSSCWATGSAAWSPSNPGIGWSPAVFTVSSATRAISDCWSTRWAGHSPFGPAEASARRLGMDRRQFLRTSCGMATAFVALNDVFGRIFDVSPAEAAQPEAAA